MRFKIYRLSCLLACSLFLGGVNVAMADDTGEPSYQNTAQEGHATNLREAALPAATEDFDAASDALDQAEADLLAVTNNPVEDPTLQAERISVATKARDDAQIAFDAAKARKEGLEDGSLVSDLRAQGIGWGEIAHELGVHPGTLGLGHTKDKGLKSGVASAHMSDETETPGKTDKSAGGNGNKGDNGGGGNGGGGNGGGGGKSK